jgi:hypothetical protein
MKFSLLIFPLPLLGSSEFYGADTRGYWNFQSWTSLPTMPRNCRLSNKNADEKISHSLATSDLFHLFHHFYASFLFLYSISIAVATIFNDPRQIGLKNFFCKQE